MSLLEDLNSGKYNLILIIILFVFMFHQYWDKAMKEPMADVSVDIKDVVKQLYLADVEAIRNLSEIATKLQKEGLTIPGNLTVTGALTVNGNSELKGALNYLPKGTIVSWTGTTAPAGWILCDGQNGTPDLRGRFVIGMGQADGLTKRDINQKGGEENVTLKIEQMPQHTHVIKSANDDVVAHGRSFKGENGADRTIRLRAGEGNLEPVITLPVGNNQAHNNMPPFYVLAYIMKA